MPHKSVKQQLTDWDAFSKNIKKSTPVDRSESDDAKRHRMAALEADFEAWVAYYFPAFAYAKPMPFHVAASQRIINHPEWYEVRMWSRELAKSTRCMFEVLYLTLVGHPQEDPAGRRTRMRKRNVLVISSSEKMAIRLLDPYRINLESNDRIINDYGPQVNYGNWEEAEFVTQQSASFRAIGAGQSPRGTRNQEVRPDIILFDDIDTDEDCRNPEMIKNRWKWIEEAVMPTRSVSKATTILFCGNRIAVDCCVVRACKYADWGDLINIRDGEGRSTWPQKNTEANIDRVLKTLSYAAIQKEYFNNPITEGNVFKNINFKDALPLDKYALLCCYTDPSYKESKKNDYKATVLVGKYRDEFHVLKAHVFQGTVAQMIDAHYDVMDYVGPHGCYYLMEQVFLQDMFMRDFYAAGLSRKRTIPIAGDTRTKPDKFVRIESLLEPLNRNGKLYFNAQFADSPGMKVLAEQFLAFAPGSRAHDDGPDAVEGAVFVLNAKLASLSGGGFSSVPRSRSKSKSY